MAAGTASFVEWLMRGIKEFGGHRRTYLVDSVPGRKISLKQIVGNFSVATLMQQEVTSV